MKDQYANQWEAIKVALEAGLTVEIDETRHDLINRGYVARPGAHLLTRVATHYEWKAAPKTSSWRPLLTALVATTIDGTADVELFSTQEAADERLTDALIEHGLDGGRWVAVEDEYGGRWVEYGDEAELEPTGRTLQLQPVEVDATR